MGSDNHVAGGETDFDAEVIAKHPRGMFGSVARDGVRCDAMRCDVMRMHFLFVPQKQPLFRSRHGSGPRRRPSKPERATWGKSTDREMNCLQNAELALF